MKIIKGKKKIAILLIVLIVINTIPNSYIVSGQVTDGNSSESGQQETGMSAGKELSVTGKIAEAAEAAVAEAAAEQNTGAGTDKAEGVLTAGMTETGELTTGEKTTSEAEAGEQVTGEHSTSQLTTDETTTSEPSTGESATEKSTSENPTISEETATEPSTGEPSTGEPATEKPTSEKPTTSGEATTEPTTEGTATGEPSIGEPATDETTTGEPSTGESATEEPTTEPTTEPVTQPPVEIEHNATFSFKEADGVTSYGDFTCIIKNDGSAKSIFDLMEENQIFEPTRENYRFAGWKDASTGKILKRADVTSFERTEYTYIAQWTPNYRITIDMRLAGGNNIPDTIVKTEDSSVQVSSKLAGMDVEAAFPGCTFVKWMYCDGTELGNRTVSELADDTFNVIVYPQMQYDKEIIAVEGEIHGVNGTDWYTGIINVHIKGNKLTDDMILECDNSRITKNGNGYIIQKTDSGTYSFYIKSNAGKISDSEKVTIRVDNTDPLITIISKADEYTNSRKVYFNVTENESGIKSITVKHNNQNIEYAETADSNEYYFTVDENGEYIIQVIDNAGLNSSETYSEDKIIKKGPDIKAEYADGTYINQEKYTNTTKNIKVTVSKNTVSDAKITDISYYINNSDKAVTADVDKNAGKDGRVTFYFSPSELVQGENNIVIDAKDKTGNKETALITIFYDTGNPEITEVTINGTEYDIDGVPAVYGKNAEIHIKVNDEVSGFSLEAGKSISTNLLITDIAYIKPVAEGNVLKEFVVAVEGNKKFDADKTWFMVTDSAGNNSEKAYLPKDIVVDSKAPEIRINAGYTDAAGGIATKNDLKDDETVYSNKKVSTSFNIIDEYTAAEHIEYTVKINGEEKKYTPDEVIVFEEAGAYKLEVYAKDKAGNDTTKKVTVVIDDTAPQIQADDNYKAEWTGRYRYTDKDGTGEKIESVTVKFTADNGGSTADIDSIYYMFSTNAQAPQIPLYSEVDNLDNVYKVQMPQTGGTKTEFTVSKSTDEDFEGYCYVWCYNTLGTASNAAQAEILIENKAPKVKVTYTEGQNTHRSELNNTAAFDGNVVVSFDVSDAAEDGSSIYPSSGVNRLYYSIMVMGHEEAAGILYPDEQGRFDTVEIDSDKINGRPIQVNAWAIDEAGNRGKGSSRAFIIDSKAPEIKVAVEDENKSSNQTNNGNIYPVIKRTIKITVDDLTFNKDGVNISFGENAPENSYEYRWSGNECTIVIYKDGRYSFNISAKDSLGNSTDAYSMQTEAHAKDYNLDDFIIDTTAPDITLIKCEYIDSEGNSVTADRISGGILTKNNVTLTFKIEDANIDTAIYDSISDNIKTVVLKAPYAGDIYSVSDIVGNTAYYSLRNIRIENTAPHINNKKISDTGGWTNSRIKIEGRNTPVTDTYQEEADRDGTAYASGVSDTIYYIIAGEGFNPPENIKDIKELKDVKTVSYADDRFVIDISNSDYSGYCYIWTYDNAGNLCEAYDGNRPVTDSKGNIHHYIVRSVNIDTAAPSVKIEAPDSNSIVNGNYTVKITAADHNKNGVSSGLSTISYVVLADGERTQSGSMNVDGQTRTLEVEIDAKLNEGKNIVIQASASDNAGNSDTAEAKSAGTDTTLPQIRIIYDNNNVINENFFNRSRTATVTVTDHNFSRELTEIITEGTVGEWMNNGDIHTVNVVFDKDGEYTLSVKSKDLAGNEAGEPDYADSVLPDAFTLDMTMPVLTVTYDNNNANNGSYYNAPRTASIRITEHNFDEAAAAAGINVPVSGWVTDGDEHMAVVSFSENGEYSLEVSYTDKAGNKVDNEVHDTFIIDKDAPVITVTDVTNRMAYNGEIIAPVVSVTDKNYDAAGIDIKLVGGVNGDVTQKYLRSSVTGESGVYTFGNIEEDDLYTLTVIAYDKAGNKTASMLCSDSADGSVELESITFSVNRNGSVYSLDDTTKGVIKKAYIQSAGDITFFETNVNILNTIKVTLAKDNQSKPIVNEADLEEITLKEGDGYRIEREVIDGGWSQYRYVIDKENFAEDGIYRLVFYSVDTAGNVSENTMESKLEEVNFAVDSTAPVCSIADLEEGYIYNASEKDVVVMPSDNLRLSSVRVLLNGEQIAEYNDAESLSEFTFTIKESSNPQNVRIVCEDVAGNKAEYVVNNIYVTTSAMVRFINNKTLVGLSILLILILLAIIIAVILIIHKKRRKQE